MLPEPGAGRPGDGRAVIASACDVVVIGSGAYGASVTYHLAAAGRRVVLVDRAGLGTQTSPRAAGLATGVHHTLANSRVAVRAIDAFCAFPHDTGQPLTVHRTGSLKIARREQDLAVLEADLARAAQLGIDAELVGADDVARRAPFVDAHEVLSACWLPGDLYLDPTEVLRGYLAAVADHGATLVGSAPVRTVVPGAGGGLTTVLTDGQTIDSAAVVNAAGAWIRELAARSGVVVPALPIRHQLLVTGPVPGVRADQPCVRVVDTAAYVRPERDGLLFGAYEPDPVQPLPE